jgi:hypothetical protein
MPVMNDSEGGDRARFRQRSRYAIKNSCSVSDASIGKRGSMC